MKFGVISDIHGNVEALKMILNFFESNGCDEIICSGDLIGIGPFPEETVQLIKKIPNLNIVYGNHEEYLIRKMNNDYSYEKSIDEAQLEHHNWVHEQLSQSSKEFILSLPRSKRLNVLGTKIYITHYAGNDEHYFDIKQNATDDQLDQMFESIDADIIIFGHNHKRDFVNGKKMYIDVGSLGCPGDEKNIARAGILTVTQNDAKYDEYSFEYNVELLFNDIDLVNYPNKDFIKKFFMGYEK